MTGPAHHTPVDGAIVQILVVTPGDPFYEPLIGRIRDTPELLEQMWADAEHRLEEHPDKMWIVAAVLAGGYLEPAAWCSAQLAIDGANRPVLLCGDNYERRGAGRDLELYQIVFAVRQSLVVEPTGVPALTYLFEQPIALHEQHGWYKTGHAGISEEVGVDRHRWWELRRDPDCEQSD